MKDFLGEYRHSLDAKGRLILPANFRGPLEDGAVIGHRAAQLPGRVHAGGVVEGGREIRQLSKQGDAQLDAAGAPSSPAHAT